MTKVFGIDLVSVSACAQVSALADGAVGAAVVFIASHLGATPTLAQWDAVRLEWRNAYMVQRDMAPTDKKTAGVLDTAWLRNVSALLESEYEMTKPKAASAEAVKKAEQRKKPEAVEAAQTVKDLDAIVMPSDAVEAAKLAKAISDKRLALVKAEVKVETMGKMKAQKEKRESFIAFFKELPPAEQELFYALRDKRFGIVLSHVPREQLTDALSVLDKAAKASKSKTAA